MLKQEQIRPFLLGALISAGGIIIVNYTASNEGYFSCMKDVAHIKYMERAEEQKQEPKLEKVKEADAVEKVEAKSTKE